MSKQSGHADDDRDAQCICCASRSAAMLMLMYQQFRKESEARQLSCMWSCMPMAHRATRENGVLSYVIDDPPYRFSTIHCQVCGRNCPWPWTECLRCQLIGFLVTLPARHLAKKRPGHEHVLVHVFPFLDDYPELTPKKIRKMFLLNVLLVSGSPFRRLWGNFRHYGYLYTPEDHAEKAMQCILSFL